MFQPNENTAETIQVGLRAVSGSEEDTATIEITIRDDEGSTPVKQPCPYIPGDIYFGTTEGGRNNLDVLEGRVRRSGIVFSVWMSNREKCNPVHETLKCTGFIPFYTLLTVASRRKRIV